MLPDISQLCTAWWSLGSVGRAIAIVQYASCLLYGATDNPVFTAWTRIGGGGPPSLWEFAGHLYTHRWQEPNVSSLREALTPQAVAWGSDGSVRLMTRDGSSRLLNPEELRRSRG